MDENVNTTPTRQPSQRQIAIEVEPAHLTKNNQLHNVYYRGALLLEGVSEPLFETCRLLTGLGVNGTIVMFSRGETKPRMTAAIAEASALAVREGDRIGPRFVKWMPRTAPPQPMASSINEGCHSSGDLGPQGPLPAHIEFEEKLEVGVADELECDL